MVLFSFEARSSGIGEIWLWNLLSGIFGSLKMIVFLIRMLCMSLLLYWKVAAWFYLDCHQWQRSPGEVWRFYFYHQVQFGLLSSVLGENYWYYDSRGGTWLDPGLVSFLLCWVSRRPVVPRLFFFCFSCLCLTCFRHPSTPSGWVVVSFVISCSLCLGCRGLFVLSFVSFNWSSLSTF